MRTVGRMVYRTAGLSGETVPASGRIAFPTRRDRRLALVDYGHRTTATRDDVPSAFGLRDGLGIEGRWTSELFASAGFAVVLPDYRLSSPFGGHSSVRERDRYAGAAEVDHGDEGLR